MAHMRCNCGTDMWDGDGHIVYDVFSFKELKDYISKNGKKTFEDAYNENAPFYENNDYFWLCDDCKTVHMWSNKPEYCYRTFKIKKNIDDISINEIKKLSEYLVMNINKYTDEFDKIPIKDLLNRNPVNSYKYYATDDLTKVYIINSDENKLDKEYELIYESFVKYDWKSDSYDNLLIYTIDKSNKGHEYIVENGIRKQKNTDDFPHKQVNFMITEKDKNGGSISYADPNKQPEIYTINTMEQFNKKYGKVLQSKNKEYKYIYVEYLDMIGDRLYCYKSEDDYEIGDVVIVPRGYNEEETEAKIINIKYYSEKDVPYPYKDLKEIIDYADKN